MTERFIMTVLGVALGLALASGYQYFHWMTPFVLSMSAWTIIGVCIVIRVVQIRKAK